jgi:hypothetical protein
MVMSRRIVLAAVVIAALVLATGLTTGLLSTPPSRTLPITYAINCQEANDTCLNDLTKTSALEVDHVKTGGGGGTGYVQPITGETWEITARWVKEQPCQPGDDLEEQASVDVSWNGNNWVLSNEQTTDNILDIDICQGWECTGSGGSHSWNYTLIVDVNDPETQTGNDYNLMYVRYDTTSVDDGKEIMFTGGSYVVCDRLGYSTLSPTSQTFSATDVPGKWQSSRCPFDCDISGTSVVLYYQ